MIVTRGFIYPHLFVSLINEEVKYYTFFFFNNRTPELPFNGFELSSTLFVITFAGPKLSNLLPQNPKPSP